MDLTNEDRKLLRVIVKKELETLKEDGDKLMISNSPFLNKEDDPDLPFLKSMPMYQEYLEKLLKRL